MANFTGLTVGQLRGVMVGIRWGGRPDVREPRAPRRFQLTEEGPVDESDRSEATTPAIIRAAAVGHRERDGGPVDYRVDVINPATLTTLASLSPDVAVALARGLCEAAGVARAQAQLLAAQER